MTDNRTIHLQGIGLHIAKPVASFSVGDKAVFNYGFTYQVIGLEPTGSNSTRLTLLAPNGKTYTQTKRNSTLMAYAK